MTGVDVQPRDFASLSFSSANYDASVFESPDEIRLDRGLNPHVAFGFGPHLCLGAAQAGLVVRSLMKSLCARVARIETLSVEE